ncbi:DNA-binding response regulator [Actinopolyspora erythraea]|uniref:DNA-binding response regulator n=1 Tax=Actinopolyspora erythraea TaxID=414996 RepID=A0A099D7F1_9ACTN|nr:LytTR family DNA-binding domain-containing protein [Actinopolyspora erythraea]ASU78812.1 DNA-binding response regulator [Actinopolyspora erythraea]KGI81330.1 LytR family transcriptional regulator [Actinopolyspora erythraea]
MTGRLRVLAVDDVRPALDELCGMLRAAPEVDEVVGAGEALEALRLIQADRFDVVFLDISMPGLDGIELASLLARLSTPPVLVFVTAYDGHAVTAYDIGAVDYVLKPVRSERLSAALDKVSRMVAAGELVDSRQSVSPTDAMPALPVETAGRTKYVRRGDVRFVSADGDYVRLHTPSGEYVVRMPISRLEEYWCRAGFQRVHRSFLVALHAVLELRSDSAGGLMAHTEIGDVPVSRRHARDLREQLLQQAQRAELGSPVRGSR